MLVLLFRSEKYITTPSIAIAATDTPTERRSRFWRPNIKILISKSIITDIAIAVIKGQNQRTRENYFSIER
jgi:hypothetical protein